MSSEILIVEDNNSDVVLLRIAFAEHGVDRSMKVLTDGEEAIQYVNATHPDGSLPCLIILDLNLPRRDGMEVLRTIRGSDRFRQVPVVILTTSDSPTERETAEQIGVRAYLRKPVDFDSFLALGKELKGICDAISPSGA